jgi:2-C-methyl-D-erythritol 2,4-cyclodiphosphate synthase
MAIRVGIGYDSHRFAPGRPLVLGGVTIPHPLGLAGHSDADAVAHALTDAILGAAACGSIGGLFPDTDARWKGADSMVLLHEAYAAVKRKGFRFVQGDVTVIAEAPRVGPHAAAIAARLAEILEVSPDDIGIKGKTNEGMGFVGRGEGVAVIAVATVEGR